MGSQEKAMTRIIKPLPRGQITIPAEFRRKLGIDEDTFLSLTLKGRTLEVTPAVVRKMEDEELRDYDEREITRFLREDKIDKRTAAAIKRLLGQGKL